MKLQKGMQIEFESGMQYEITKVFDCGLCDLIAIKPQFEWLPNFFPEYYSIQLKDYKILNQAQTILKDEICPECYSNRLFKCLEQRKCLDCNHKFESIKFVECSEEELFRSLE